MSRQSRDNTAYSGQMQTISPPLMSDRMPITVMGLQTNPTKPMHGMAPISKKTIPRHKKRKKSHRKLNSGQIVTKTVSKRTSWLLYVEFFWVAVLFASIYCLILAANK